MTYTVLWKKSAEDELTELWLAAEDRSAISRVAEEMDAQLRFQPHDAGESRDEGKRVLLVAPLGVMFEVFEEDRVVRVGHVWRFRRPGD